MEHYDVIIIGTGAGGGTLAHRLAPTGKRILLLERGGYLPREPENWDSREVFGNDRYVTERALVRQGRAAVPAARAVLRRRQHEGLRRDPVPPARARLRRGPALRRRLAGVADLLRRPRAVLRRGRAALPRPRRARRGPDGAAGARPVPVPGRLARAAHPAAPRRPRRAPATTRSTCRSASTWTSPTRRRGRCVRCDRFDGFPCLTDGKADAHVLLRAAGAQAPERDAARRTRRSSGCSSDGRSITGVVEAGGETHTRRRRRRVVRRRQLGRAAAALGERRRTRPTRSAATTWRTSTRA